MLYVCGKGCTEEIGMSEIHSRAGEKCKAHGLELRYGKGLGRSAPLDRTDSRRYAQLNAPRRKPLKRGKGFAASKAQRDKVRNRPCIVCGQCSGFDIGDGGGSFVVDPAHLLPRSRGGCDHEDCVVPLCRLHHREYEDHRLDILIPLVTRKCFREMAHVIEAHELSPTELLRQLTGSDWAPVERRAVA